MRSLVVLLGLAACGRLGFEELEPLPIDEARRAISVGNSHACALRGEEVWCWGDGRGGQTGAGTLEIHAIPVRVANLPAAINVAAGGGHACAVTVTGDVYCWGASDFGQAGPIVEKRAPFEDPDADRVPGLPGPALEVSTGERHTCAVLADRTVWCWGSDQKGQLGRGATSDESFPTPAIVDGLANIVQISLDDDSSCALDAAGAIACWGENSAGQLGDRTAENRTRPVTMQGLVATAVTIGGDHTCALVADGRFACWGANYTGELGVELDESTSLTPRFSSRGGYLAIEAGTGHTCAVTADRIVECWGANDLGQLGNGTFSGGPMPQPVGIANVAAISSGRTNTCAMRDSGEVLCWGLADFGQLGEGSQLPRVPVVVPGVAAVSLAAGLFHTCASDNTVVTCWGYNWGGQLGNGTFDDSATPVVVTASWGPGASISQLVAGDGHTCALVDGSEVWCWGANNAGQLGNGTNDFSAVPVQVPGLPAIRELATNDATMCVRAVSSDVYCWGHNKRGQLADGTAIDRNTPALVGTGFDVLVGGRAHFCGNQAGGTGISCWGGNDQGQVGNGDLVDVAVLTATGQAGASMWAGAASTCVRGSVTTCWGNNSRNILLTGPDNGIEPSPTMSALIGETAASDNTACRVSNTGQLECWGDNHFGQVGNAELQSVDDPQVVALPPDPVIAVLGATHACVRMFDRSVYCWGDNVFGQVGSGTMARRSEPVTVAFP